MFTRTKRGLVCSARAQQLLQVLLLLLLALLLRRRGEFSYRWIMESRVWMDDFEQKKWHGLREHVERILFLCFAWGYRRRWGLQAVMAAEMTMRLRTYGVVRRLFLNDHFSGCEVLLTTLFSYGTGVSHKQRLDMTYFEPPCRSSYVRPTTLSRGSNFAQ